MSPKLQEELKQNKPFKCPEEEAALNVLRTAGMLDRAMSQALKPHGITPTQYNVLRILRGAGENGLCRNEVGERLIREVPDVTRLLDRMEEMDLIGRHRGGSDRRFVTTKITPKGLELADRLDDDVHQANKRLLGHLSPEQLQTLVSLLEIAREKL
jgi:DNA-binding MarR family transcriptional regulator